MFFVASLSQDGVKSTLVASSISVSEPFLLYGGFPARICSDYKSTHCVAGFECWMAALCVSTMRPFS